jgi:hypothetical protein
MALAVQISARTSRQNFQPGDQRAQQTENGGYVLIGKGSYHYEYDSLEKYRLHSVTKAHYYGPGMARNSGKAARLNAPAWYSASQANSPIRNP